MMTMSDSSNIKDFPAYLQDAPGHIEAAFNPARAVDVGSMEEQGSNSLTQRIYRNGFVQVIGCAFLNRLDGGFCGVMRRHEDRIVGLNPINLWDLF